jgi:hypothetical protein
MNNYLYAKLKPYLYGKQKRWSIKKLTLVNVVSIKMYRLPGIFLKIMVE